jgi:hypothetical protein
MEICYVPNDMDAPGCYRCLFPGRQLAKRGHKVVLPPYTQAEDAHGRWITKFTIKVDKPDPWAEIWVLQQRKERHWLNDINSLRRWGVATVADIDDNYIELPEYNPAFLGTHPYRRDDGVIINRALRRKLGKAQGSKVTPNSHNRLHMHDSLKFVDAVSVSTPYLAELYSKLNPNVTVVRNYLDWDIWDDIQPQYEVERERLRIGYLASFKYRQADLNVIAAVIPKFLKRHPEVDFVANSEATHDYLGVPLGQRVLEPEYGFYPKEGGEYPVGRKTAVCDIGLVPLAMNGLNQAKSHLKGMEYNAAGIPFIASPTESYKDYWCVEGENGFLAASEGEWLECLEYLVREDTARRKMGRLGRLQASENTFQKRVGEWESFYASVLGDQHTRVARQAITVGAVQKATECAFMLRESAAIEPKVVVELGSARGGTYWAFARAAHPEATLVSIDLVGGSPIDVRDGKDVYHGRPQRGRMRSFVLPTQTSVLIDASTQEESTVARLREKLEGQEIDVLFIDADHRYEGVKRDFELYEPLVRSGGKIFFHDVLVQNDKRSGVHILWAELKKKYQGHYKEFVGIDDWGLGSWGGIGMLAKP